MAGFIKGQSVSRFRFGVVILVSDRSKSFQVNKSDPSQRSQYLDFFKTTIVTMKFSTKSKVSYFINKGSLRLLRFLVQIQQTGNSEDLRR